MNRRQLLLGGGVALAAAGAGVGVGVLRYRLAQAEAGAAEQLFRQRFARPEGGELVMDQLRGKPLLVNFWATWCVPCIRELPELNRFQKDFAGAGWTVVALAIDSPSAVREFLTKVPVQLSVGLAGLEGTELVRELGNAQGGLPFSVLINAQGRIFQRKLGKTSYDELAGWVRQA
jgi:thiol-disulfide isomerase/thioredoxin